MENEFSLIYSSRRTRGPLFSHIQEKISSAYNIDTFYTNDEGYLITPEALVYGTGYYLIEVATLQSYVLEALPFTLM